MKRLSTTSQYGTLTRGEKLIPDAMKTQARHNLVHDIQGGAFVKEWTHGHAAAFQRLERLRELALAHPMSIAEDGVLAAIREAQGWNMSHGA